MKIIVEGLVADQQMASRPIGAMNLNRCHKASYYTFSFDLRVVRRSSRRCVIMWPTTKKIILATFLFVSNATVLQCK